MTTAPTFASAREAAEIVRAGLGFLAAADATAMAAETQAQCLQILEQATAMSTAARASILAAFTTGQGYAADADYSPRAWLINRTRITKGTAVAYTAWARRAAAHPEVAQVLAAGEISESFARTICQWTDKLPEDCREAADAILVAAAKAGADVRDLAGLAGEIYARSLPDDPGKDQDQAFEDRSVKLETTFDGAGVLTGDLTPECASVVTAVLDALSAPAGAEDTRSYAQRYHDALHEAMQRLVTAGLLPERAGQPVKVWAHISLADLMVLDGSSALLQEWTAGLRARWAGHRAEASAGGSDGGAWLDGDAADRHRVRRGHGPHRDRRCQPGRPGRPRAPVRPARPAPSPSPHRPRRHQHRRRRPSGRARPRHHAGLGSPRARDHRQGRRPHVRPGRARVLPAAPAARRPARAGRACRWTSATPRPSRPRSATPSSCATSTANGPESAASPPRPARSTTSSTRRTAARPASRTACCSASFITRS